MNSNRTHIAIIGAGLAGLYAARLLQEQGMHDFVVLEARPRTGGRILSPAVPLASDSASVCFDLGPSWFWPEFQPALDELISALGLERFAQFESGDMLIEHSPHQPPMRRPGFRNSPTSMRLHGGMSALVETLAQSIPATQLLTGQLVTELTLNDVHVTVMTHDTQGATSAWQAKHVLLALPPRLAAEYLHFSPALPTSLLQQWRDTATWMAPHAKYFAIYERPFWREQGLSGEARSMQGPLGEIHDASLPDGPAALFGFLAMPASVRQQMNSETLHQLCRAQLTRIFGPQAGSPLAELSQDWSQEALTASHADQHPSPHHLTAPATCPADGPWQHHLCGIASEWSTQFPGYLAGAIDAAMCGVQWLQHLK
ncbi:FAD-dependent oxidoreductase [Aquitalea sp. LB_tupeE]|uniref:flavin monoamine oxidase family protein n=1 Tax=Aquitalea sp. LB_tupeE TaxID=2748078 RepID=UPI0015B8056A|nr:FAD-dependent oxidoreductase [Aquitalea sp. LB_tupeE]NWK80177.1 FAD-dependent oxidoreductase [Aquitalea sp. LB_tupeE]